MPVVTILRLVFNVTGVDGNLTSLLLRSLVDIFVRHGLGPSLLAENLSDGLRERRLAVIDVPDGANVDVGLVALERRQRTEPGSSQEGVGVAEEDGGCHVGSCGRQQDRTMQQSQCSL